MTEYNLLRWIPLLPLLAAVVHGLMLGLFRVRMPRWGVIALSCGSVLLAFLFAVAGFFRLVGLPGDESLVDHVYTWIGAGVGDTRLVGLRLKYSVARYRGVRAKNPGTMIKP